MTTAPPSPISSASASHREQTPTAADLLVEREALASDVSCSEALKLFEDPHAPPAYAVTYDGGFGLISRLALASMLAQQFGRALFERRPVSDFMDPDPLVVDASMTIHEISEAIADSKPTALETGFIITDAGRYLGVGVGLDLIRVAAEHAQLTLERLKSTQASLVRSEKLASLGSLVGGIAHEINTPIGVTVTAATQFAQTVADLRARLTSSTLTRTDLEQFLGSASETARLICSNAERTAELVASFKQIAVDRTSDEHRSFNVKTYLDDVLRSLKPQLKRYGHRVEVDCPKDLDVDSHPGALSQVVTNLLTNALIHAFDRPDGGNIAIHVAAEGVDWVELRFADDGRGIPVEHRDRVFEPFFTTARSTGGSGLGLNIVHNIVTATLGGEIALHDASPHGALFVIRFPRRAPDFDRPATRPSARFGEPKQL